MDPTDSNLREWLRQRSGKELADLLTKVAT